MEKKLSEKAALLRKRHARENWKNKVKRRNLEKKAQTLANVDGNDIAPEPALYYVNDSTEDDTAGELGLPVIDLTGEDVAEELSPSECDVIGESTASGIYVIGVSSAEEPTQDTNDVAKEDPEDVDLGLHRKKKLSEKRRIKRNIHSRLKWKNKQKQRKLEKKGQTAESVAGSNTGQEVNLCVDDVAGDDSTGELEEVQDDTDIPVKERVEEENGVPMAIPSISDEDLEELMIGVKKDPFLKSVVEDIETGGPIVMSRYLSDPEVLQKLGQAMGFGGLAGDNVNTVEHTAERKKLALVEKIDLSPLAVAQPPVVEEMDMMTSLANPAATEISLRRHPEGLGGNHGGIDKKSKRNRRKLGLSQRAMVIDKAERLHNVMSKNNNLWFRRAEGRKMQKLANVIDKMKTEAGKKSALQDMDESLPPKRVEEINEGKEDLGSLVSMYEELKREKTRRLVIKASMIKQQILSKKPSTSEHFNSLSV